MISTATNTPTYIDAPIDEIVRAAQRGDRQAFGQLVERYQRAVYATVYRRLRNDAEAQEVCQEVFLRAMRKIGQLQESRCFGSWLRSIAERMAINWAMRRKASVRLTSEAFDAHYVESGTPLTAMLAGERRVQLRQGLRRLRTLDRQTLTAFYFDGSSLLEMSRQFSSPVGTIKRRLHVARRRLAEQLKTMASDGS